MKKRIILILIVLLVYAFGYSGIDISGKMAEDSDGNIIQSGRSIRLYDDNISANEHVNDGDFTLVTGWIATNDIATDSLSANWTWADSNYSYLSQPADSLAIAFLAYEYVKLTYTVYDSVTVAGGSVALTIGGFCDSTSTLSTVAGGHTYYITALSTAATDSLYFKVNPDTFVTAGEFSIDDISITGYNCSPLSIADGADVTITIPENAAEIMINPSSTEIKIEIGSAYYATDIKDTYPCIDVDTLKLRNDSGETATVSILFIMLEE